MGVLSPKHSWKFFSVLHKFLQWIHHLSTVLYLGPADLLSRPTMLFHFFLSLVIIFLILAFGKKT